MSQQIIVPRRPQRAAANAYFERLKGASYNPSSAERHFLGLWYHKGFERAWYAKLYDFGIMTWGSSAPCQLRGKVGGSITPSAGSITYTNKRVTFSGSYFDLAQTPTTAGMATTGACMGYACVGTLADISGIDMGCQNATSTYWQMFPNAFTTNALRMGNATTAATSGGASGNNPGLYVGNRVSAQLDLIRYNGTKSTLATRSDASGGAVNTRNLFLAASNENGTAAFYTNRAYTFWFTGTGFTTTECDNFMLDTWTMLTNLGAT